MQTQVAIIESSLIAADVADALPQTRSEQWVRERTRARAVGEQIIAITAVGLTPIDAANLANLVSERYVGFASGRTDSDAEVRVTTLRRRAADLESRVRALDGEIGGVNAQLAVAEKNSPESASLTGTVEGLRSQRQPTRRQAAPAAIHPAPTAPTAQPAQAVQAANTANPTPPAAACGARSV